MLVVREPLVWLMHWTLWKYWEEHEQFTPRNRLSLVSDLCTAWDRKMSNRCLNWSNNVSEGASKYNITNDCALFDFAVYTVIVGTLCILGITGNAVSFSVLWRDTSKSATGLLLRALAVADSLVLIVAIPLYSAASVYPYTGYLHGYYEMYMNILPFLWPCYLIPYTGTILLTVLVSLNRYFAVCRPFNSNKCCSTEHARRHVLYIALFSILYNIPRFFEYEKVEVCTGFNQTKEAFDISAFGGNKLYRIIYANVLYFLVMHGGPLLSLLFLNARLIIALKKRQKRRNEMGKGGSGYQQDITLVLVVVVFVFIFCQTPTFIDHILWTVVDETERSCGHWHYYYTALGDMMAILNSSVNFVIYILTSRRFRQGLVTTCAPSQEFLRLQSQRIDLTVASQGQPLTNGDTPIAEC